MYNTEISFTILSYFRPLYLCNTITLSTSWNIPRFQLAAHVIPYKLHIKPTHLNCVIVLLTNKKNPRLEFVVAFIEKLISDSIFGIFLFNISQAVSCGLFCLLDVFLQYVYYISDYMICVRSLFSNTFNMHYIILI